MISNRPVVMITGATQYTGLTCAKLFAQRGYNIVITSRNAQKGENAAETVRKLAAGRTRLSLIRHSAAPFPVIVPTPGLYQTFPVFAMLIRIFSHFLSPVLNPCGFCRKDEIPARTPNLGGQDAENVL